MPDPKQMAGIPRPVDDLPNGAVSVRLIRGELSNNIASHPVELRVGSKVLTVKTDESGRAQFNDLTILAPGQTISYVIVLYLPTTAGNADQGLTAVIGFHWQATG